MGILKDIFSKKEEAIASYDEFWNWFAKNEKQFFKTVKQGSNIEKDFFEKLSAKLNKLKDGFYYLAGMYDDNTVELVLSAEGIIKNIVFVEELVACAPSFEGWKFTALKPALNIEDVSIEMNGYKFSADNLNFYAIEVEGYPDEIDITIVYDDFIEEDKETITSGIYIFLDNYLGELHFTETIDAINVIGKADALHELIPIEKLKEYLLWRQKEFVEKYEGLRHDTNNDSYSGLEAELESGNPLIAVINTDLLDWENKASHPWMLVIEIKYDGEDNNGMPDEQTYKLLDEIENDVMSELKDFEGYLNIGRQTANSIRQIYFACKEFRKPSKLLYQIQSKYSSKLEVDYQVYKDKYWRLLERFSQTPQ
jgi:hypothetical protein